LWARRAWGERAGLLRGHGNSDFDWSISVYALHYSRVALVFCCWRSTVFSLAWNRNGLPLLLVWAGWRWPLLTKGLIAPVFFLRRGGALSAAHWPVAALARAEAGDRTAAVSCDRRAVAHCVRLANPDQGHPWATTHAGNVHGFFYFYFINEHVLRFFSCAIRTTTTSCRRLTGCCTWSGFSVESVSAGGGGGGMEDAAIGCSTCARDAGHTVDFYLDNAAREDVASYVARSSFAPDHLAAELVHAWTLLFFSLSTNQEYYTFPVWPPLVMLICGVWRPLKKPRLRNGGQPLLDRMADGRASRVCVVGVVAARCWLGIVDSRNLPYVPDIGTLLAHRGVGDYTLSMSHLFDLTGASFAALRLPAALAPSRC
jgi:hypothetical protein